MTVLYDLPAGHFVVTERSYPMAYPKTIYRHSYQPRMQMSNCYAALHPRSCLELDGGWLRCVDGRGANMMICPGRPSRLHNLPFSLQAPSYDLPLIHIVDFQEPKLFVRQSVGFPPTQTSPSILRPTCGAELRQGRGRDYPQRRPVQQANAAEKHAIQRPECERPQRNYAKARYEANAAADACGVTAPLAAASSSIKKPASPLQNQKAANTRPVSQSSACNTPRSSSSSISSLTPRQYVLEDGSLYHDDEDVEDIYIEP